MRKVSLATVLMAVTSVSPAAEFHGPAIPAAAYVLVESQTGTELTSFRADDRLPPASLTKLMTAYVLFGDLRTGRLALNDRVTVSREAARLPGARMFLVPGETVSVENLLQGMLVQSGNDATRALAEHVSGDQTNFVKRMNDAASRLGLNDTHYVNVGGLHRPGHYTSARDLARLAVALRREFPEYRHWFAQRSFTWAGVEQANRNLLLRDPGIDGLKTGHTEAAGFNLVVSAERQGTALVAVSLGSADEQDRRRAGRRLLEYGFRNFETRVVANATDTFVVPVPDGDPAQVTTAVPDAVKITLARVDLPKVATEPLPGDALQAPITRGQHVGVLRIRLGERVLATPPLVAVADVPARNLFARVGARMRQWFDTGSPSTVVP